MASVDDFDSTAKLMLEALSKASLELEKLVAIFIKQVSSLNQNIHSSLDEALKASSQKLNNCFESSLDELANHKESLLKRFKELEQQEVELILACGQEIQLSLANQAQAAEQVLKATLEEKLKELNLELDESDKQIGSKGEETTLALKEYLTTASTSIKNAEFEYLGNLKDYAQETHNHINAKGTEFRDAASSRFENHKLQLASKSNFLSCEIEPLYEQVLVELEARSEEGKQVLEKTGSTAKFSFKLTHDQWQEHRQDLSESFNHSLVQLGNILKETYQTKLSQVVAQTQRDIAELSSLADAKIAAACEQFKFNLAKLQENCLDKCAALLNSIESLILEHSSAHSSKSLSSYEQLCNQLSSCLRKWGIDLGYFINDTANKVESDFLSSAQSFQQHIEYVRSTSIEMLEKECKLMQKDMDKDIQKFQREVVELEEFLPKITKAGHDAALTVAAYHKALLSFDTD